MKFDGEVDRVGIGGIELKGGLDVRAGFLEFAGGGGNRCGKAMVNRKFRIEINSVTNVLRGAFELAVAVVLQSGEVMRARVVGSGLEQRLDVMNEVAITIKVQRGKSAIVMKVGGIWIEFKRAGGLSEGLFVMPGVVERGNSGNEVSRVRHRLFEVSQCGMTLAKTNLGAISKWGLMIDD